MVIRGAQGLARVPLVLPASCALWSVWHVHGHSLCMRGSLWLFAGLFGAICVPLLMYRKGGQGLARAKAGA